VAADGSVKLSDFGLARAEYRSVDGYTVNFSSPEQLRQRNVGTSSDIWAFGMLLYSLFSEALPFTSLMNRFPGTKIPKSVMLDELSNNLDGFQHDLGELASCLDREIVETIQSCLSLEPL
jgi:serine/threonine protein kinase